jgi:DNA repair photolyase
MKITQVKCKTALSKSNLPGLDYSLNPYRGCQHNCAYCYVPNVLRIKRSEWGSFVDIKKNIPVVLSKELKIKKKGIVAISTVTDPYQPIEKKLKLTRYCLEQLLIHDFPVCIQTKSDLITRDIDLISKFTKSEVMFSIATLNNSERNLLEPYAPSIKNRLDALKMLSELGIKTSIFFGPVYPTIKIKDLPNILDVFIENGAKEIMVDKLNIKPGIRENVEKLLNLDISRYKVNYDLINKTIFKICKEKNIKIINAF